MRSGSRDERPIRRFSGYHGWLDEEEAGRQGEEERVHPQEDLAGAQPRTQSPSEMKTPDTVERPTPPEIAGPR